MEKCRLAVLLVSREWRKLPTGRPFRSVNTLKRFSFFLSLSLSFSFSLSRGPQNASSHSTSSFSRSISLPSFFFSIVCHRRTKVAGLKPRFYQVPLFLHFCCHVARGRFAVSCLREEKKKVFLEKQIIEFAYSDADSACAFWTDLSFDRRSFANSTNLVIQWKATSGRVEPVKNNWSPVLQWGVNRWIEWSCTG